MADKHDPLAVINDAQWLAHRYDPAADAFHFVAASRADHRAATFLTNEYLSAADLPTIMDRKFAMSMAENIVSAPIHFIFHSAYCCSTLLTRAFDIPGVSMGLKEPVLLNDLIGWRHRGGEPRQVAQVLDQSLTILARPFNPNEAVVVKPSNVVNPLIRAMLAMRPQAQFLFLYAPLEAYLISIARKGLWGRHWVRDLLIKLRREGMIDLGLEGDDYLALTDIQVAAVGWLAQQAHFAKLLAQVGTSRIVALNSDELIARPQTALAGIARHFRISLDVKQIDAIVSGPTFMSDAKTGKAFITGQRDADRAAGMAVYKDEITKVIEWAHMLAQQRSIPMELT